MPISFYAPQVGFLPTGVNGTAQVSSVFIGRAVSGTYEGVGFGQGGRPDPARVVQINLCKPVAGVYTQYGSITLNVDDIIAAETANSNVPANLNLTLKEVAVCDAGISKRMIIVASQVYSA